MRISHPFEPVIGKNAKVLILGTMPSPASREQGFYYGHPRNRFWRVLAGVLGCEIPADIPSKKRLITRNALALWDVLAECDIERAADSSIKRPHFNDIAGLMAARGITQAVANGQKAGQLLKKAGISSVVLPSTSPANARMGLERLIEEWSVILKFLR